MGTWSRPLFAKTSPGVPSDYMLDTSAMSAKEIQEWKHNAFLDLVHEKTILNLEEFMNTGCDTHKIMDYMTSSAIWRWQSFFYLLATQNPTLESVQFHFFCLDSREPFMFEWKRGVEHFTMNVGSDDSIWYTTKNPKYPEYDEPPLLFDEEEYKKNHEKVIYRTTIMKPISGVCWH